MYNNPSGARTTATGSNRDQVPTNKDPSHQAIRAAARQLRRSVPSFHSLPACRTSSERDLEKGSWRITPSNHGVELMVSSLRMVDVSANPDRFVSNPFKRS